MRLILSIVFVVFFVASAFASKAPQKVFACSKISEALSNDLMVKPASEGMTAHTDEDYKEESVDYNKLLADHLFEDKDKSKQPINPDNKGK